MEKVYTCSQCNEVLLQSRQETHDKFWCACISNSDDIGIGEDSEFRTEDDIGRTTNSNFIPTALVNSDSVVSVQLANLSGGKVQHVLGSSSTGGGLWHSEVVLAEWCVRKLREQL